mmetsp:Transcript_15764/g.17557  ORF Transcript_15764/g.17557 Transcript_15764/m.17557 type:complete len:97 (-) Transcript_15764:115-405(-)
MRLSSVPSSTIEPSDSTQILSQCLIVSSLCAMVIDVAFFATVVRAFWTNSSLRLSRALVASSNNIIFGLAIIARAIATLCFCPPDKAEPPTLTRRL